MGRFEFGARCCNNCSHWQCHAARKIEGNPPANIFTCSNLDRCSLTGRNTLSENCCAGFSHLYGASDTHALPPKKESENEYLNALMEYYKNR